MAIGEVRSNCCLGVPVDFYMVPCTATTQDEHVEAAVQRLWEAIRKPGVRAWHPRHKMMILAEFRDRLRVATQGRLKPITHIKGLRDGRCHLYEIRWQDVPISLLGSDGKPSGNDHVHVRLIHTEPHKLGVSFVGLHAHEKLVLGDEATHDAQDLEIDEAERIFDAGYPTSWGISRR